MKSKSLPKVFIWCAIFLIVLVLGLYVRFYPLRSHTWSNSTEQATALVITKLKAVITQQVMAQSGLSDAQRNQLIEERFAQTIHQDSAMVKKTIQSVAYNIRGQSSDAKDHIYLQEADGYYYYDLTQNILKTGRMGREFKGSKYFNEKMAAPFGFWQPINLHPYVGLGVYQIIKMFKPDISLMTALCFVGPILSAIALLAFLSVCIVLRLSPLASLIGAVYFYLAPIFVKRSAFAWYDDDSYNLIFPLLILAVLFKALDGIKTRQNAVVYGIFMAFLFTAYSLFWHGWGYTFAIVLVSGLLIAAAHHFLNLKSPSLPGKKVKESLKIRELIIFFAAILLGTLAVMSLLFGVDNFFILLKEGLSGLDKLTVNQLSLWPNLFVAVGELKQSSLTGIMAMTGNFFSWACAGIGIIWGGWTAFQRRERSRVFQLIILVVLLLADVKITLSAERFILLCLIPVAVLTAIGISTVVEFFRGIVHSSSLKPGQPKIVEILIGTIVVVVATFFPIRSINAQMGELLNTIFNPTWEQALLDIKNKTPHDSIITSWWPPGHFIKAIAERRVTFDGATITKNIESYWVANAFLTSDERKAAGILRMLNTGGIQSVEYLKSLGMKTSDTVSLLHYILSLNRSDAQKVLSRLMPADHVQKLLSFTHSVAPPSYLLLYSELMEKNIGLQFVAKWNFQKVEELNKNPQALRKLPSANSPAFFEFLWSTMGGPYKYSEVFVAIDQDDKHIDFEKGITIDLKTMSASVNSPQYGAGVPLSIVYFNGKNVVEKTLVNHNLNYSIVLFESNNRSYCRLMDQELANSLLAKMYLFQGQGLELFKPLSLQSSLTGRDEVFVFELQDNK